MQGRRLAPRLESLASSPERSQRTPRRQFGRAGAKRTKGSAWAAPAERVVHAAFDAIAPVLHQCAIYMVAASSFMYSAHCREPCRLSRDERSTSSDELKQYYMSSLDLQSTLYLYGRG